MPWQNYRSVVPSKRRSKSKTAKARRVGKRGRVRTVNAPKNPW